MNEEDAQQSDIKHEEVSQKPTLFIVLEEDGDVNYAATVPIDIPNAIAALELAKAKMVATHFGGIQQERQRAQQQQPNIVVPNLRVKPQ